MDDDFVAKFVKSKGALSDSDRFTFTCKDGKGEVILGYEKSMNSTRISINVDCTCDGDVEPISFSAKYLKEILNAKYKVKLGFFFCFWKIRDIPIQFNKNNKKYFKYEPRAINGMYKALTNVL